MTIMPTRYRRCSMDGLGRRMGYPPAHLVLTRTTTYRSTLFHGDGCRPKEARLPCNFIGYHPHLIAPVPPTATASRRGRVCGPHIEARLRVLCTIHRSQILPDHVTHVANTVFTIRTLHLTARLSVFAPNDDVGIYNPSPPRPDRYPPSASSATPATPATPTPTSAAPFLAVFSAVGPLRSPCRNVRAK